MISSLRDKAELEELYAQMSAKEAEREAAPRAARPPMSDEGTILVTDIRGLSVGQSDPASVMAALLRIMKLQEAEVLRQEGVGLGTLWTAYLATVDNLTGDSWSTLGVEMK